MLKPKDNPDIESAPLDEQAVRGHAIAAMLDAGMKVATEAFDARADAEKPKEEEGKSEKLPKADAEGTTLDRILTCLDGLSSKFDSISGRMDAMESKQDGAEAAMVDKKRKDGEEEEEEVPTRRGGDPKGLKADKKSDSYTDADRDEVAEVQSNAERVCSSWGLEVRKPMIHERADEYRRRVSRPLQSHSKRWQDVDLKSLSGKGLAVAVDQIFADSLEASDANSTFEGQPGLHEIRRTDPVTGHRIREFRGSPMAWMSQFTGQRRLAKFNLGKIRGDQ